VVKKRIYHRVSIDQGIPEPMRIAISIFIITTVAFSCSKKAKTDELKMTFANSAGKTLKVLYESDFAKVDWEEQCYFLKPDVIRQLRPLKLHHGTIELIYNDEVLATWKVVTVYEAELQTTLILVCDPQTGEIIMDDNICVGNIRYDYYFRLKDNAALESYLRRLKLIP
jgi:hypothetical protein